MSSFELGWAARPFKEQFPQLPDETAAHLDADNKALIRLRLRGYLTDSARDNITKKIGKAVEKAVRLAREQT